MDKIISNRARFRLVACVIAIYYFVNDQLQIESLSNEMLDL